MEYLVQAVPADFREYTNHTEAMAVRGFPTDKKGVVTAAIFSLFQSYLHVTTEVSLLALLLPRYFLVPRAKIGTVLPEYFGTVFVRPEGLEAFRDALRIRSLANQHAFQEMKG